MTREEIENSINFVQDGELLDGEGGGEGKPDILNRPLKEYMVLMFDYISSTIASVAEVFASKTEAEEGTATDKMMSPKLVTDWFTNRIATANEISGSGSQKIVTADLLGTYVPQYFQDNLLSYQIDCVKSDLMLEEITNAQFDSWRNEGVTRLDFTFEIVTDDGSIPQYQHYGIETHIISFDLTYDDPKRGFRYWAPLSTFEDSSNTLALQMGISTYDETTQLPYNGKYYPVLFIDTGSTNIMLTTKSFRQSWGDNVKIVMSRVVTYKGGMS